MSSAFASVLDQLARQRGVRGSLAVSERDGIIIDANVLIGQESDRVAALTASVYRKARLASEAAGLGAIGFLQLEGQHGWICAVGRGDVVLVVVADGAASVGLVRVELLRALASGVLS